MTHDTAFPMTWQYLGAVKKRASVFALFFYGTLCRFKVKANIFRMLP